MLLQRMYHFYGIVDSCVVVCVSHALSTSVTECLRESMPGEIYIQCQGCLLPYLEFPIVTGLATTSKAYAIARCSTYCEFLSGSPVYSCILKLHSLHRSTPGTASSICTTPYCSNLLPP